MISVNLQILRKTNRLTQEEVAEKIGVSRQAVAKWESGESLPDIDNCAALARLYGVTLDSLVGGEKESGLPPAPKGKYAFGVAVVGERGQIVIPKRAREIFGITPGDSLMVLGDEAQGGIALIKSERMLRQFETFLKEAARPSEPGGADGK